MLVITVTEAWTTYKMLAVRGLQGNIRNKSWVRNERPLIQCVGGGRQQQTVPNNSLVSFIILSLLNSTFLLLRTLIISIFILMNHWALKYSVINSFLYLLPFVCIALVNGAHAEEGLPKTNRTLRVLHTAIRMEFLLSQCIDQSNAWIWSKFTWGLILSYIQWCVAQKYT
jgi:hypothetical protein